MGHHAVADGVAARDVVVGQRLLLRVVVFAALLESLAHIGLVDPGIEVEFLHAAQLGQHAVRELDGLQPAWFDGRVQGVDAVGAEEHVAHFLFDLGPLFHLLHRHARVLAHPVVGLHQGLDVGHHGLGVGVGKVLAHHHTVKGGHLGLRAVKDLAGETAVGQQVGEGHEVAVRVDLLFLQVGGAHLGALAHQVPVVVGPAAFLHGLQHHPVGGRTERHGDRLALEVGQLVVRAVLVHDHAVARTEGVVRNDGDQLGFVAPVLLAGGTVHQQRVVAHHPDLQLVGHHAIGDRRAGGEVLPVELPGDVGVLAGFGQVFFQQLEFLEHDATGDGVGGRVLRADANGHFLLGLCLSHRGQQGQGQRQPHRGDQEAAEPRGTWGTGDSSHENLQVG
ncbi:hypothetical protein FQZ97_817610 [compost metagenome]